MYYIKSLTGHIVAFTNTEKEAQQLVFKAQNQYFRGTEGTQIYTVHKVVTLDNDSNESVNQMVNEMCCPCYNKYNKKSEF